MRNSDSGDEESGVGKPHKRASRRKTKWEEKNKRAWLFGARDGVGFVSSRLSKDGD